MRVSLGARVGPRTRGTTRGPELVTNGTADTDATGWSGDANTAVSSVAGKLRTSLVSGTNFRSGQSISGLTIGLVYEVSFTFDKGTLSGNMLARIGSTLASSSSVGGDSTYAASANGLFTFTAVATSHWLVFIGLSTTAGQYFDLDNISVRQVIA